MMWHSKWPPSVCSHISETWCPAQNDTSVLLLFFYLRFVWLDGESPSWAVVWSPSCPVRSWPGSIYWLFRRSWEHITSLSAFASGFNQTKVSEFNWSQASLYLSYLKGAEQELCAFFFLNQSVISHEIRYTYADHPSTITLKVQVQVLMKKMICSWVWKVQKTELTCKRYNVLGDTPAVQSGKWNINCRLHSKTFKNLLNYSTETKCPAFVCVIAEKWSSRGSMCLKRLSLSPTGLLLNSKLHSGHK